MNKFLTIKINFGYSSIDNVDVAALNAKWFSFASSPELSPSSPNKLSQTQTVKESTKKRVNFSQKAKSLIREHSGGNCHHCGIHLRKIPGSNRYLGELAHIFDASPNFGVRPHPGRIFDKETSKWRYPKNIAQFIKSEENGLLVCSICHKLIDHSVPPPSAKDLMYEKKNPHMQSQLFTNLDLALLFFGTSVLGFWAGRMSLNLNTSV